LVILHIGVQFLIIARWRFSGFSKRFRHFHDTCLFLCIKTIYSIIRKCRWSLPAIIIFQWVFSEIVQFGSNVVALEIFYVADNFSSIGVCQAVCN